MRSSVIILFLIFGLISAGCVEIPSSSNTTAESDYPNLEEEFEDINVTEISTIIPTPTPIPIPTSFVEVLDNTKSPDYHAADRKSIFFQNNSNSEKSYDQYLFYRENGIELNTVTKNRQVIIQKSPWYIRYFVDASHRPTISWAEITVTDPFESIIDTGGFNRKYTNSTPQTMKFYQEGLFYIKLEGEYAKLNLEIYSSDANASIGTVDNLPNPDYDEFDQDDYYFDPQVGRVVPK